MNPEKVKVNCFVLNVHASESFDRSVDYLENTALTKIHTEVSESGKSTKFKYYLGKWRAGD